MESKNVYFNIADLILEVNLPNFLEEKKILPTFMPFTSETASNVDMRIKVQLDKELVKEEGSKLLTDVSYILEYRFRLEETENYYYITIIEAERNNPFCMRSSKDFRDNEIFARRDNIDDYFRYKWIIMAAFGQFVLSKGGLLLHSSTVVKDNVGYAFLGVSGTGKSTHSRLWLNHITGAELLNDDNPVVRIKKDGTVWIYGSPWSGKTDCYKNKSVPLKAMVRLEQAPENNISTLSGKKALLALLPSGSGLAYNDTLFQSMVDHMSRIIEKVQVGYLKCLPDAEAAEICYKHFNS